MDKIDLDELVVFLNDSLKKQTMSGRSILDRFRVIDESSRKTAPYLDPYYAPFYYYLGKYIKPKSLVEIGFDLGLLSSSFLTSCKSVEHFFGYKSSSEEFSSNRIGKSNIKQCFKGKANFYVGNIFDKEFFDIFSLNLQDLIIINDETVYDKHLEYLDVMWSNVSEHGFIIAEYITRHMPAKDAFLSFCESKNRKPAILATRYGTGILQK